MMEPLTGRGWMAQREGTTIILFLRGDWTTREEAVRVTDLPLGADHIDTLRFDSTSVGPLGQLVSGVPFHTARSAETA